MLSIKYVVIMVSLGLALYYDIKEGKIKNFITITAASIGLVANLYEYGLTGGIWVFLKGGLFPVLMLVTLWQINVLGAGDIKLFAAIGAIMGLPFVINSFVYSVFAGGIISLGVLIYRGQLYQRMKCILEYLCFVLATRQLSVYNNKDDNESKFPFSTAIVPGTMLQLCFTIFQVK
jgi:prepilin peptidase CpaA